MLEIRRRERGEGRSETDELARDPLPLCVEHMNVWSEEVPADCTARFVPLPRDGT